MTKRNRYTIIFLVYAALISNVFIERAKSEPESARAKRARASHLMEVRDFEQAILALTELIQLDPNDAGLFMLRGMAETEIYNKTENARADLDRALELAPDSAEAWFARGCFFDKSRKTDDAASDYDHALQRDSRHTRARLRLGDILISGGYYSRAAEMYTRGIEAEPDNARYFAERCLARRAAGDEDAARPDCIHAASLAPQLAAVYVDECVKLAGANDYEKAEQRCLAAAALEPEDPFMFFNLAWRKREQYLFDEANAYLEKGIALNPAIQDGYIERGELFVYRELYAEAARAFELAVEKDAGDARGWIRLSLARDAVGRTDAAVEAGRRAVALEPENDAALAALGYALANAGAPDDALAVLQKALEINPRNTDALLYQGNAYMALGQAQKAVESFTAGIGVDRYDFQLYLARCGAYRALGLDEAAERDCSYANDLVYEQTVRPLANACSLFRYSNSDNALEVCSLALSYVPKDAEVLANRANIYEQRKQYEKALDDYNAAISLSPEPSKYFYDRGVVRAELGDNAGAASDFSVAIAADPDNAFLFESRGEARLALGDEAAARADFDRAAALDPEIFYDVHEMHGLKPGPDTFHEPLSRVNAQIAAAPDDPALYSTRAYILWGMRRYQEALSDTERIIALDPINLEAILTHCTRLYDIQRYGEAISACGETLSASNSYHWQYQFALSVRGSASIFHGEPDASINDFTEYLAIVPDEDFAVGYIYRAQAYLAAARPEDALNDLNKAQQIDPSNKTALLFRAQAHLNLENLEQAWNDITEFMAVDPNDSEAYSTRAGIYEKKGRIRAAVIDFAKALEITFKTTLHFYE